MLHISMLHTLVEKGEFSLKFIEKSGAIITGQRCICTSFHSSGRTLNLKFCDSGEIRKIRRVSIIEFNGQEVAL
jgi:hypothetical protein